MQNFLGISVDESSALRAQSRNDTLNHLSSLAGIFNVTTVNSAKSGFADNSRLPSVQDERNRFLMKTSQEVTFMPFCLENDYPTREIVAPWCL